MLLIKLCLGKEYSFKIVIKVSQMRLEGRRHELRSVSDTLADFPIKMLTINVIVNVNVI